MVQWRKTEVDGYAAWTGETGLMSVSVIPELGSKMISLRNLATGREWLWRSGKPLGNGGYGSSFAAGDESGWDEMFPAINAGAYPEGPWQGQPVPDHGEVWSMPWEHGVTDRALTCRVEGQRFPYLLEKTYSFVTAGTLRIDYAVANRSEAPFSFLWAAHPLLRAREGMTLHVAGDPAEIEVSYSEGGRLGQFGDKQPWPLAQTADGVTVDLSIVEPNVGRFAEKYYFTGQLRAGFAGLRDPETGEALTFAYPVDRVPYLAVWANYGGFGGNYHLALEPATGRMDDLAHAVRQGEAAVVPPGGMYRWHLEVNMI
ncbi:hypothetical protein [Paenibacillus macerans]|uniref:hypothetical protein n=1 Tax=Paenibacillus macerans TaxID=44252 RepID=UPI003D3224B9